MSRLTGAFFGACGCLFAACVFTACPSCAMDPSVVSVWGGDFSVPKIVSLVTVDTSVVAARFTAPVTVTKALVVVPDNPAAVIPVSWEADVGENGGNGIKFLLGGTVGIGVPAALSATVTDARGNSLSFSLPFTGYNDRVASLLFNEIRTDYDKPKVEYIEFLVVKGGNLGGIEISNAMNVVRPCWEFPAVEVAAGDFILYHLRSVEEGLVNETGAIDVSAGVDARPGARDFWDTLTSAPLKKTNVLLVRERKGGKIMDALLCAEAGKTEWPNETVRAAAEEAVAADAWLPGSLVADAAVGSGTSPTRTLGRSDVSADTDMNSDWRICATGKCTPGATNTPP